jgi:host factor-I protein
MPSTSTVWKLNDIFDHLAATGADQIHFTANQEKRLSALNACYTLSAVIKFQLKDNRFVDSKPAPQNIQDGFLNLARREKITVTIYLVNGAKLLGRIKSFDKFSLLLETGSQEQLIFKHAISTISQARRATGELRQSTAASESQTDQTAEASVT